MPKQYNGKFSDRKLPERAKLMFYFPNPEEGDNYTVVRLPFFENPTINESKRARYQDHKLIARSSNLYTYLGADSRNINLKFSMTLPHILELYSNNNPNQVIYKNTKPAGTFTDKKLFLNPQENSQAPTGIAHTLANNFRASQVEDNQTQLDPESILSNDQQNFLKQSFFDQTINNPGASTRRSIVDVISFWLNVVRASVVNNAQDPLTGPPVIRLRHGIMYQDVPCICKSYSIDFDESAGYDLETLLPRKIDVSMSLEEFRSGNFGKFNNYDIIERDNLAGWEAVIEKSTMDPGYFGGSL